MIPDGCQKKSFEVDLVQTCLDALGDGRRAADAPKVHEEEARLLGEHMAVQGGDLNAVIGKRGDDRIDFVGGENEIAGGGDLAGAGFLEINRLGDALRGGERGATVSDGLGARDSEREHAAGPASLGGENVLDGFGEGRRFSGLSRSRGLIERSGGLSESGVKRFRDFGGRTVTHVMKVEDVRSLVDEVIVDGADFKACGAKAAKHRVQFAFEQDEIAHDGGVVVGAVECSPGAERETRFDLHAGGAHVKIGAREAEAVNVAGFLAGAAECGVDLRGIEALRGEEKWRGQKNQRQDKCTKQRHFSFLPRFGNRAAR